MSFKLFAHANGGIMSSILCSRGRGRPATTITNMHNHKGSISAMTATGMAIDRMCVAPYEKHQEEQQYHQRVDEQDGKQDHLQDDQQVDQQADQPECQQGCQEDGHDESQQDDCQQDDQDPLIPVIINNTIVLRIPRSTLLQYTYHDNPPDPLILHSQTCPIAATHILTWLSTQPTNPRPLPRPFSWITFEQACQRWALAHALRIPRRLLGDELRDEIWLYIWSEPALRADEFKMVLELCGFDGALVRLACQRVRRNGRVGDEELRGLVGLAEGMLEERKEQRLVEGRVRL